MDREAWFEANRLNWNDRAGIHAISRTYGLERYRDPDHLSGVVEFDRHRFGDIHGVAAVHLQCHIGTDTISLARLGAKVVGYDFSERSLAVARELSLSAGTPAEFVEGNVYDAPARLDRTFGFVYTGVGAVNWLPDIEGWARVVAELLEPGGRFYIREGHPAIFPLEEEGGRLVHRYPFWHDEHDPFTWDEEVSYTDGDGRIEHSRAYEWNHPISSVINALIGNGLVIDVLDEHDFLEWQLIPMMVEEEGRWYMPQGLRDKMPLMYSIAAHKPD